MAGDERPVKYRTRRVETLGLSTRIVMQPVYDPCPLAAICNALLLRNVAVLDPSAEEVSRRELLNLVGLAVMHYSSSSQMQNDSEENACIREQKTNACLIILPHLTYKLNMVVRFTKINDFDYIPEHEVFDLLDAGPYHGWVVDPRDTEIAAVIGSKSHQTLMAELTAFRARKFNGERNSNFQGDSCSADSVASAGVLLPTLSYSVKQRRGYKEEEEDMYRALILSLDLSSLSESDCCYSFSDESTESESYESESNDDSVSVSSKDKSGNSEELELSKKSAHIASDSCKYEENDLLNDHEPNCGTYELPILNDTLEKVQKIDMIQDQAIPSLPRDTDNSQGCYSFNDEQVCGITKTGAGYFTTAQTYGRDTSDLSDQKHAVADYNTSNGTRDLVDISAQSSCPIGYMPIYDLEDCKNCGNSIPIEEENLGTLSNKKQVGMGSLDTGDEDSKKQTEHVGMGSLDTEDEDSKKQTGVPYDLDSAGKVIEDFLENSGSQLTVYGLRCLKEGIKEGDPCVFFCDYCFSTILKFGFSSGIDSPRIRA